MMIICATEVSFLGSIEEFLEMRITFYDATTPGGVEAFTICYACISTNTLGYSNKYVLFVCWLVVVAFIESAHTRRGFWITLCGCLWQHTHSHSQLPLLPHFSSLSLLIPHDFSSQLALLGFVRASSVGAVFASFGYARNYCAQCLKNSTLPGQFHSKLTMMWIICECVWVCVCVFACMWVMRGTSSPAVCPCSCQGSCKRAGRCLLNSFMLCFAVDNGGNSNTHTHTQWHAHIYVCI